MVEVMRLVSDKNNEGAGYIQTLGLPPFSYVAVTCHKCDLFYENVPKRAELNSTVQTVFVEQVDFLTTSWKE